jgi:glycosyltransferase involved in cell wall biosynthesis
MKVLHVIPGIEEISGGPSQAVIAISNALNQSGIESFIATTRDPLDRYQVVSHKQIQDKIFFFERSKIEKFAFSPSLYKWLRSNIVQYDVIHIHSLFNFPSYVAAACANQAGVPYVIRPAGCLNMRSIQSSEWQKKIWMDYIEYHNFKNAAAYHATSIQEKDYISKILEKDNVHTIPLGIELPLLKNEISRSNEQKLEILFLSRLNPKKNIPTLLSAIKKVVDRSIPISLKIAGKPDPGKDIYEQELYEIVIELGLSEHVKFIGYIQGEDKSNEFNNSHVFILPSYDENFGIAVIEAMAHGLPVIISDKVALAEDVILNQAGIVIDCEDSDGIANAIISLYHDEKLRLQISKKSLELAAKFSWNSSVASLSKLYSNILREKKL